MNKSLGSWTPRVMPVEYDSLMADFGCVDISGTRYFAQRPFIEICTRDHSTDADSRFNRSDLLDFSEGPSETGGGLPWSALWAAWISGGAARISQQASVTLPNVTDGDVSPLFPTTAGTKISLGFTTLGLAALAIQTATAEVTLKWFKNSAGTSVGTKVFEGFSAVLFNNGILNVSDDEGEEDLVVLYLKDGDQKKIFARFERDDFAAEYVVNDDLPIRMAQLIGTRTNQYQQLIYGRDVVGRDVTLYSDYYLPTFDNDALTSEIELTNGKYAESAVEESVSGDIGTLWVQGIQSGIYSDVTVAPPSALQGDVGTLWIQGIQSGEYI